MLGTSRYLSVLAVAAAALSMTLAPVGCTKSEKAPAGPAPEGQKGAAEAKKAAPTVYGGSQSALATADGLSLVPADAYFVAVAANPAALLDDLGRERVIQDQRSHYERAVAEITGAVGHNVLDPANLPQVGIDPTKPAGFAWLAPVERELVLFFAAVPDPEKLKTSIYRAAGRHAERLTVETVGDALIIYERNDEELCLVLRDGYGVVVATGARDEWGLEAARRVAKLAPADSLQRDVRFRASAKGLDWGADLALWFDSERVMQAVLGLRPEDGPGSGREYSSTGGLEKMLAEAEKRDASAVELDKLRAQVEEAKRWDRKHAERRSAEQRFAREALGAVGPVALGIELGDRAVTAKALTQLTPSNPFAKLLRPSAGVPALITALDTPPVHLQWMSIDKAAALKLANDLARLDGQSLDAAAAALKSELGFDLHGEILPAFDGEFGMVVSGDVPLDSASPEEFYAKVHGTVVLGLADKAKATALLDRIAKLPMLAPIFQKRDGGYTVTIPMWRPAALLVSERHLVFSTDTAYADRLLHGTAGKLLSSPGNSGGVSEELRALLSIEGGSSAWMLDMGAAALYLLPRPMMGALAEASEEPVEAAPGEPAYTEEYRKLARKRDELRREAAAEYEKRIREEQKRVIGLVERLGVMAAVAELDGDTLVVRGGQYLQAPSIGEVVSDLFTSAFAGFQVDEESLRREMERYAKEEKIRQQMRALRQRTLQQAEEQQRPPVAPQVPPPTVDPIVEPKPKVKP